MNIIGCFSLNFNRSEITKIGIKKIIKAIIENIMSNILFIAPPVSPSMSVLTKKSLHTRKLFLIYPVKTMNQQRSRIRC